ncbi:hypothetical protein GNY06_04260 [Elizabethkingia argentiflava]|uniref:Uncharacterized protein n=1 Tax=Elizabethkingia argenteiflava TaxID=2681556 RepID=A0A845PUD4_9FLAO|nr:hypothetical protein [Elizabethkingia argenteiflava]NAW50631.1 hypothetical protein [Elizabethkingia argenteiflava]
MIQDKDFTLRLIRQLTQSLEKLLLGKPEESLMQKELDFDALMKDIFKIKFEEVSSKTSEELIELVEERETKDHADYYELLGNLFYFHFQKGRGLDFAQKSKVMYQKYLQTSGVFSLPIINRIKSIESIF